MKRPLSLLLAISSLGLLLVQGAGAGTRPHYGGTVQVQVRETLPSVDLIASKPSTTLRQELAMLLFDRLVQLDENGAPRQALADFWIPDPQRRVWQFHIRRGVSFHDGSPVTAAIVAAALASSDANWKLTTPNNETLIIETDSPTPHLPELISLPQYSIYARTSEGSVIGTGAFKLGAFEPNRRLLFKANEDYWGGRPYLDSVDILMGNSVREQLIGRRLDRDDVVELGMDQARTLGWSNQAGANTTQHLASSAVSDLYAIYFRTNANPLSGSTTSKLPIEDARVREALALTIDRAAISSVLLQKQGEPANALLPQWLTGYEFLFSPALDLERARKLRFDAARNAVIVIPLAYDSGDNVARAIAERVAVNAREANITVQAFGEKNLSLDSVASTSAQAVLVKLPLATANASAALAELAMLVGEPSSQESSIRSAPSPEAVYAAEREMLQDFRIVPIAHVPQIYWLSPRVRNWEQPRDGGWRLKDVWVETERQTPSAAQR